MTQTSNTNNIYTLYIALTFIMNIALMYIVIIMQIYYTKKLQENKDENVHRFAMSALRGKLLERESNK